MDIPTMLTFLAMLFLMITFPTYQKAYTTYQQRLQSDTWLFQQCQDPTFAARMRAYTDSCEHVHTIFSQSPWWVALQETYMSFSTPSHAGAWMLPLTLAVLATLPTLLLPLYRTRMDMWETQRILRECSPCRTIKTDYFRPRHHNAAVLNL